MKWDAKKIAALLMKSDRAVYRALLRLDSENRLSGADREMALTVRSWDRYPESIKSISHPLDSGDMRKARAVALRHVRRLTEVANG